MPYTQDAIGNLAELSNIEKSRFAYLAVTGKLENAIRDHLAFTIQSSRGDVLVGRDITLAGVGPAANGQGAAQAPRFDLVVFDQNGNLEEVTEAKQFYTFDYRPNQPASVVREVREKVLSDANRLKVVTQHAPNAVVNLLLLVCHATADNVADHYDRVSKYDLHRPARHQIKDFTAEIAAGFAGALPGWQWNRFKCINLGRCFGIDVGVTPIFASIEMQQG